MLDTPLLISVQLAPTLIIIVRNIIHYTKAKGLVVLYHNEILVLYVSRIGVAVVYIIMFNF